MSNPLYDTFFGCHAGKETTFLILQDGRKITHARFVEMTAQFAHALTQSGLKSGDRVAAQIHKSPEALALYAACTQTGTVFLPLNTAYTAVELSYFVEDSGAKLLVCDPVNAQSLAPIAEACKAGLVTLDGAGKGTLMDLAKASPTSFNTVECTGDDLAAFLYTSGTTGRSKGAMLTQNNLLSNAKTLVDLWQFTSDDVLLHVLPIFHTHGLFVASNVSLMAGGAMVFLPTFDLDHVFDALPNVTSLMGVPTFYTRLLGDDRFTKEASQHMRLFISGSAPLLAETHKAFEVRTGHRILERYGMTETNMNVSNPYDGERRAGTVGFPLPGTQVQVCDPNTGDILPQGEIGMIEVRGPNVFKGYWNMPEKTAQELRENGFFITGDLGQFDKDGYLSIVGRSKDLIISGGYNIYPKEVELVLDDQNGVLESAVIGVPHADFGEAVVGILVAQPEGSIDLDTIKAAMSENLARFKQPKHLVIIHELPRNTMGKVQKNILRETYDDIFNA